MIKGQSLKQLYESLGPVECVGRLQEGLQKKVFRPEDFSLRDLAESFVGPGWVRSLNPLNTARYGAVPIQEAGDGVDISAFSNITGQILFTKILEGWQDATMIAENLFNTVQTEFDGEKLPWLSHPYSEGDQDIHPGKPYPETAFGERFIQTPHTTKKGEIVSITKEMVYFDRPGQALTRANEIGKYVGYQKEQICLKVLLGLVNNYNLNGTSYNTYLTAGSWVNSQSSAPLVDWTSINEAFVLFQNILDPDTSLPIVTEPKALFVMPARLFTARRITAATEVRSTSPSFAASPAADSPGNVQMISGNPLPWSLEVFTSPIAYQLLLNSGLTAAQAQDYWYMGDFKRSLWYMQNWPLQLEQAPPNNIAMFERDLVVRVKASEKGYPVVDEPRYLVKMTNSYFSSAGEGWIAQSLPGVS